MNLSSRFLYEATDHRSSRFLREATGNSLRVGFSVGQLNQQSRVECSVERPVRKLLQPNAPVESPDGSAAAAKEDNRSREFHLVKRDRDTGCASGLALFPQHHAFDGKTGRILGDV